jgi:hypothetical protein
MPEDDKAAPADTPPLPAGPAAGSPTIINAPVPDALTMGRIVAIGVGLLFVTAALYASEWGRYPVPMTNLLIAAGVGSVVTSFGGQATLTGKTYIFAGVTAVMFAILWFLNPAPSPAAAFLRGKISDISFRKFDARLAAPDYVYSFLHSDFNQLRFVIFADEISGASATLYLLPRDQTETPPIRIPTKCFGPYLGKQTRIDWEFDGENLRIRDRQHGNKVIGGTITDTDVEDCDDIRVADAGGLPSLPDIVTRAYAQYVKEPRAPLDQAAIGRALNDLSSDSSDIRQAARESLARGKPEDVPAFLDNLAEDDSYRVRLGVIVALTEMLRQDKSLSTSLADKITPEQAQILVDLAGNQDRTLRLYATEFLYDLGDPRTARLALQNAAETDDARARYNWIFAARDGWSRMNAEEKAAVAPVLDEIRRKSAGAPQASELLKWYAQ